MNHLSNILPNATIGNEVLGARIVRDRHGKDIGHIDGRFYLYSGYEFAYEVYCRLMESNVQAVVID